MSGEPNKIKQVIVMRTDLGMRKGKMIAQGGHAVLAFLTRRLEKLSDVKLRVFADISKAEDEWMETSFAKVTVRAESEEQLLDIHRQAKEAGLEVHLVTDSGKTEFHGVPTHTCLAIGPDYADKIDPITGDLKLL